MAKTIWMLCGLPGCGKSTWAREKKEYWENMGFNTEIISTDGIRGELYGDENVQGDGKLVFDTAYKRIEANLNPFNMTRCIVFDATNLHRRNRKEFIKRFRWHNVKINLIYFDIDLAVCLERNANRERNVPIEVINQMFRKRDVPTLEEEFDEFIVVRA